MARGELLLLAYPDWKESTEVRVREPSGRDNLTWSAPASHSRQDGLAFLLPQPPRETAKTARPNDVSADPPPPTPQSLRPLPSRLAPQARRWILDLRVSQGHGLNNNSLRPPSDLNREEAPGRGRQNRAGSSYCLQ